MSNGRLILGLGRGLGRVEFEGFGVDMNQSREIFIEAAQMLIQALETGVAEFHGTHVQQARRAVRPRPFKSFRDRTYAAAVSPESVEIMARLGVGILIIPQKPWDVVATELTSYRDAFRRLNGRDAPPPVVGGWTFCDEDEGRAREMAIKWIGGYWRTVLEHYELRGEHLKHTKGYEAYGRLQDMVSSGEAGADAATQFFLDIQIWGTPEQCFERIMRIRGITGTDWYNGLFSYAGMPWEEAERNMRLFAREVDAGAEGRGSGRAPARASRLSSLCAPRRRRGAPERCQLPRSRRALVISEAADFMDADLAADRIYYAQVRPRMARGARGSACIRSRCGPTRATRAGSPSRGSPRRTSRPAMGGRNSPSVLEKKAAWEPKWSRRAIVPSSTPTTGGRWSTRRPTQDWKAYVTRQMTGDRHAAAIGRRAAAVLIERQLGGVSVCPGRSGCQPARSALESDHGARGVPGARRRLDPEGARTSAAFRDLEMERLWTRVADRLPRGRSRSATSRVRDRGRVDPRRARRRTPSRLLQRLPAPRYALAQGHGRFDGETFRRPTTLVLRSRRPAPRRPGPRGVREPAARFRLRRFERR
jgi:alkanesulfonate monooxygenase SsuD/methylene tetrahydromethanopterin reductase-like flavin-dependent oxidoreductase (luciferase family)